MRTNIPQSLDSLVAYQDGSVVSKTIIDKSGGTVTAFAFDKGEGLSEHKAPYEAMIIGVDGEAEVTIGGETSLLKAKDYVIMPANITHAVRAQSKFKMLLVMIKDKE